MDKAKKIFYNKSFLGICIFVDKFYANVGVVWVVELMLGYKNQIKAELRTHTKYYEIFSKNLTSR